MSVGRHHHSFHERGISGTEILPELLIRRRSGGLRSPRQTKLLLNVTIQRSPGAVRVLMPTDATVEDLIAAALSQYAKEARLPVLPSTHASAFRLHYSQFSLQSLDKEEKLMELESRNFFMCLATTDNSRGDIKDNQRGIPCLKFINCLL